MTRLKPRDTIGPFPYRIVAPLGSGHGNMADVYLAAEGDREDARQVVLKISRVHSDHTQFHEDAIHNEADRLSKLSHPGIVRIQPIKMNGKMPVVPYAANAALTGRPWFLVLEHLTGGSLEELLSKQKRLHPAVALQIGQQVAATLDYLHRCTPSQVHMDIKPDNILFRRPVAQDLLPEPVLIDFGIARNAGQEGLEARSLHYAPPERVVMHKTGIAPEAMSKPQPSMDVYALGVVLYQMLTGHRPFEGRSDKRISSAILDGNPTHPSVYVRELDADTEAVVLRAMHRDPNQRPSAGELAQQLQRLSANAGYTMPPSRASVPGGRVAPPQPHKERRGRGLVVALALAVLGLLLMVAIAASLDLPELRPATAPVVAWLGRIWSQIPGADAATDRGVPEPIVVVVTATPATTPVPTATPYPATSTPVVLPTNTPQIEPTSTPVVRATAVLPSPTPLPPTPTTRPVARPTATATPRPTSTPAVRPSERPAQTAAPPLVVSRDQATAQSTPVPTRAPAKPTATPTAAGVQTAAPPTNTPGRQPSPTPPGDWSKATAQLLYPGDGYTGRGMVNFQWQTNYELPEGQAYEPVFWRSGLDPMRDGRGYGGVTRETALTINWDKLDIASDHYQWGILLVATQPDYKRLAYLGGANMFHLAGPSGVEDATSSGGSDK